MATKASKKPKTGRAKPSKGDKAPKPAREAKKVAKDKKGKDAQFVLRLDRELRDRFVEVCQDLDTSAAREIRRFIKRFIKRYEAGELDD